MFMHARLIRFWRVCAFYGQENKGLFGLEGNSLPKS